MNRFKTPFLTNLVSWTRIAQLGIMATLFCLCQPLTAQNVYYQDPFSNDPTSTINRTLNRLWVVESLSETDTATGALVVPGDAKWTFEPNGDASTGAYWENRNRIASLTGGGSMAFNSDFLDNAGTVNASGTGDAPTPHEGVLISPSIEVPIATLAPDTAIGLEFIQYFRGYQGQTFLDISTDSFVNDIQTVELNTVITDQPFGGETSEGDLVRVNLLPYLPVGVGTAKFQFRFRFAGSYYFWIVDDIQVLDIARRDIAVDALVYPDENSRCVLTEAEIVKVRLQSLSAQQESRIQIDIINPAFPSNPLISEIFPDTIFPNETKLFTFSNPAAVVGADSLIVRIQYTPDINRNNDILREGRFDCEICRDSLGGRYVCDQLIMRFRPGVSASDKAAFRARYNATVINLCDCNDLELWEVDYPFDPGSGPVLDGETGVESALTEIDMEEGGLNYIVDTDREGENRQGSYDAPLPTQGATKVTVGIIDTGLDFDHTEIQDRFWENEDELSDPFATDADNNCLAQDNWGYNVLDPGMVPEDDATTGHGTHIGGIILKDLPSSVDVDLMIVKALSQNGSGTLYDVLCGMEFVAQKGAAVLNVSMGYQGKKSQAFDRTMGRLWAANILVVTSAGNMGLSNDTPPNLHWPSNFSDSYGNVIAVAAMDSFTRDLNPISNFGPATVDIAAPGTNIFSIVPDDQYGVKSGTSMAAAAVSRAGAIYRAVQPYCSAGQAKAYLLAKAETNSNLFGEIAMEREFVDNDALYLNPANATCVVGRDEDFTQQAVKVFPNPFSDQVTIEVELPLPNHLTLAIFDQYGRQIDQLDKHFSAGNQTFIWQGGQHAAGLYFFRLSDKKGPIAKGSWMYQP